jgi:glycosyltransferase involved in cell wall biosynthesis
VSPEVSIVIRSYNRLPQLAELLAALLRQRHDAFEIVVIEQSTDRTGIAGVEAIARDPRVRLLPHPPLGGAGARNAGAQASRGAIILFIDDDDLPLGDDWIADHLRAYDDPNCLGVSGRHVHNDDRRHKDSPILRAITGTLSLDPILKTALTYVQHDRRRIPVGAIHGTNASIRRVAWERFGGWDTDTRIEDEVSFIIRAQRGMKDGEYFAYDPRPTILRNRDVAGGLDKRRMTASVYLGHYLDFVHRILARYYPVRVVVLYPLYLVIAYVLAVGWLAKNSRRYASTLSLVGAALSLLVGFPVHVGRALWRRRAQVTS